MYFRNHTLPADGTVKVFPLLLWGQQYCSYSDVSLDFSQSQVLEVLNSGTKLKQISIR